MPNLKQKRQALLRSFEQCSEFVRGSINSVCARCNRSRCICKNQRAGQAYRLTYKDPRQKTRIVYVPRDRLPRIRQMLANYARSRRVIEALIETNITLF